MKEFEHFPPGAKDIVRQELDRCTKSVSPRVLMDGDGRRYGTAHWLRWRCWIRMRQELTVGYAENRRAMTIMRIGALWGRHHGTILHGIRRGLMIPAVNPYTTPNFDLEADFPVRPPRKTLLKTVSLDRDYRDGRDRVVVDDSLAA